MDDRRPVLIKVWIEKLLMVAQLGYDQAIVEGTNQFSKDFVKGGRFLSWGLDYEEFESGIGNYTVGLVELDDGTIAKVLPKHIKFI